MKATHYVIAEIEKDYINEKDGVITNTTIESVSSMNRKAKVISSPIGTILKEGDEIIVHHNIARQSRDDKGKIHKSQFHVKDLVYYVPLNEIFMYRRGGEWKPVSPYAFISPTEYKEQESGFYGESYKGNIKNTGVLTYSNPELASLGFKEGDTVIFSDYSEYEFEIEGRIFYKMSTRDIVGKIEE